MRKSWFFLVGAMLFCSATFAQDKDDDKTLMTIGDKAISKGEFVRIYKKNNSSNSAESKSLKEYLEMFIDFKLKVIEAEKRGMDTVSSFKSELAGYRKQLSKPYFVDESVLDSLVKESYDRSLVKVRASHLLIKLSENPKPEDTLKAYNHIMKLRERILKGEDFGKVSSAYSQDTMLTKRGGDLGYFSALQMVYPFETAAYRTELGKVSMPFRTKFGYHILKVTDKRPRQGQLLVSHIMFASPEKDTPQHAAEAKKLCFDIYARLKKGELFDSLAAKYSDDRNTAKNGGKLEWFKDGEMVEEFNTAAFAIKNVGEFSEPVQTAFGWHIIKLRDKKPAESFEEAKKELTEYIANTPRASLTKDAVVRKVKKKFGFKDYNVVSDFYTVVDTSIFQAHWKEDKAKNLTKPMIKIGNVEYFQKDFAHYLTLDKSKRRVVPIKDYVNEMYVLFVDSKVIKYEEDRLEENYPDFRYLMNEYHDGVLLFALTEEMVWNKATKDTANIKKFYQEHKKNYVWDDRIDASIFSYKDEASLKALLKLVDKKAKKGYTDQQIAKMAGGKDSLVTFVENGKYASNANKLTDRFMTTYAKKDWKSRKYLTIAEEKKLVYINNLVPSQPKEFEDVRGLITSDYQNYLEKEWIKELRAKYKVSVNEDILSKIK